VFINLPLISLRKVGARALRSAVVAKAQTQLPITVAVEDLRRIGRHGDLVVSAVPLLYHEYKRERLVHLA
jgi:hypothetical protein